MARKVTLAQASRRIDRYMDTMDREAWPAGLRGIAEEVRTDVVASRPGRGVPRDMGDLAASGRVQRRSALRVALTFGGTAAPYALVQHERLDFRHTLGEARYLVRGVERWRPGGSSAMKALKEQADAIARRVSR